jgi:hypothetical protein
MGYAKAWNLVDIFTVVQAAYLWLDLNPPDSEDHEIRSGGRPPEVGAIVQLLRGAIDVKRIETFRDSFGRPRLIPFGFWFIGPTLWT